VSLQYAALYCSGYSIGQSDHDEPPKVARSTLRVVLGTVRQVRRDPRNLLLQEAGCCCDISRLVDCRCRDRSFYRNHCCCRWVAVVVDGLLLLSMGCCCCRWVAVVVDGLLLLSMGCCYCRWVAVVVDGLLLLSIVAKTNLVSDIKSDKKMVSDPTADRKLVRFSFIYW
jgi:hypothetical protein